MLISEFVNILKKSGQNISCINKIYFQRVNRICYSFPTCFQIHTLTKIVKKIKWRYWISVILTDFVQKNTSEFLLGTDDYSLDKFSRKTRNRIRKSLDNCCFRKPEIDDLIISGCCINKLTLLRQNRSSRLLSAQKEWRKYIESIYNCPDITILSAYYENRMVGYIITAKIEDKYCIQHAFIDKKDSELTAPMNGLLYIHINKLIKENGLIKISYGLDSIKDLPELNRFKSNMLFQREYIARVFVINPLILPYFKLIVFFYLSVLKKRSIKNQLTREIIHIYYGYRILKKILLKEQTSHLK